MQNLSLISVVHCFASVHKNGRVGGSEKEEEVKATESIIVKAVQLASNSSPVCAGTIGLCDTETWKPS